MKLVFITQKLAFGDPLMGFTHKWVEALACAVDELVVIANEVGAVHLSPSIAVHSLGKESHASKFKRFWRLHQILKGESPKAQKNIDAIFCHQCPIYLLSALPMAKLQNIPLYLWYAHGHASFTAKIAAKFAKKIFTSSPFALTIDHPQKKIMGQGVDTAFWENLGKPYATHEIRMVHVGRLSPVKNIAAMIELTAKLKNQGNKVRLDLIGDPATATDQKYLLDLLKLTHDLGITPDVNFLGGMSHEKVKVALSESDYTLNFSTSNAIDKSLIETACAGLIPITQNPSFLYSLKNVFLKSTYEKHPILAELLWHWHQKSPEEKNTHTQILIHTLKSQHDVFGLAERLVAEMKF